MSGHGVASDRPGASPRSGSIEDARLIARVRNGDLQAFEQLYREYQPRLARFLTHMTHRPQLVEEVFNDTMFVLWSRPDSYGGASKLSTWIFAVAYRKALKALRRRDEPIEDKNAGRRASPDASPEQKIGEEQVHEILLRAMNDLSPEHRAVIDLTYYHDLGYREIAEIMDCPVDTVKTRMFHARRHLKRMLAGRLADWWYS